MPKATCTQVLLPGFKLQSKDRIYEIVKVLGAGSFGITYLATTKVSIGNISTTIKFAIKEHFMSASCYRGNDGATVNIVPGAKSDVVDSRADFITEANRLKRLCLKSRNIVSVNETFEANGTAYYVMEYLDGGNPSKCSEEEAVSIVMQIADAIYEIHNEHVLHLDIKPDNIVLKTNDKNETYPVLIDFGISKHFDSKGRPTSSLSAKGASPGYAPQEQYAGVSEFSPKYDIYALAAVLFYLCTGQNPPDAFKISPNQQELKKGLSGKVSPNIEKTILNAMKPTAMERTSHIKQFCNDLMGIDFAPVLNVSSSALTFGKEKAERTVSVESNIGWSIYADKEWCKVSKSDNNIVIAVNRNKESSSRVCKVVVNSSVYQFSKIISIKQVGSGTIVFPKGPTWWERNSKKIYTAFGVIFTGCIIAGLSQLLKPDHEKESKLLTQGIDNKDGKILAKYADLDSLRAFLPYAQLLYEQGDRGNSLLYANKARALGGQTSIQAEELMTVINAEIEHIQQESEIPQVTYPENAGIPSTNEQETISEVVVESNDEKFARASHDFNIMLSLAKDNYAKAYYPLAKMYYDRGNHNSASLWAKKAIANRTNEKEARNLLRLIEKNKPPVKNNTNVTIPNHSDQFIPDKTSSKEDSIKQEMLNHMFKSQ